MKLTIAIKCHHYYCYCCFILLTYVCIILIVWVDLTLENAACITSDKANTETTGMSLITIIFLQLLL